MTGQNIASFLKQLRKTSGLSANEVVARLKNHNIGISSKTLYGYESGLSMLNADVFVALCRIYKCDNPMDIFGTPSISPSEQDIIEKYRFISEHSPKGTETVNYILNREYEMAEQIKEWQDKESNASYVEEENIIYLPELYSRFSAGTGQYSTDSGYEMTAVPRNPLTSQATSIATISGDSMEPEYQNGDKVLVKTTPDIEIGEIGVWSINNELYIKAKGDGELISLNPDYDNIAIKENDSTYCIGKVLGKLD